MKSLKIAVGIVLAFSAFSAAVRLATHGFTENNLYKIEETTLQDPLSTPQDPALFDQTYHYLGYGTQLFALSSEDGSKVIKFFRKDRTTHPLKWCRPLLGRRLQSRLDKTLLKRKARFAKTLKSCVIAYKHLKEETGLIGVQLAPNSAEAPSLTYTDAIGVLHHLQLDTIPYLIQKRAAPFYPTLERWILQGEVEKAKAALAELITLIENRCKQDISDKDPNLATNFGWIESHPIQIDVGRFSFKQKKGDPKIYRPELIRTTAPLRAWLDSHCPELATWIQAEVGRR